MTKELEFAIEIVQKELNLYRAKLQVASEGTAQFGRITTLIAAYQKRVDACTETLEYLKRSAEHLGGAVRHDS